MEMPDFLFIQLGRDRGRTFVRKFDTKSPFDGATGYVNYDEYRRVYDELKQENEENCRLLGMSAERELALLSEIDRLKAKLAKTEWQPIETAPKDGTKIITCCMSPSEYTTVKAGFMVINGYDDRILSWPLHNKVHFPATHWMPRPEPPTTEETK